MKHQKIQYMCLAGVFTAVVFVFTAYLHFPSHTGYTHVGDGFIYLAACLLPMPYAMFVGAAGAFLSDCLMGYAIWAPGSVIIKAATVLFFTPKGQKVICRHNILALLPAGAICIGGYYLYEALITGNFLVPLAGIPGYITQALLSSIFFVAVGLALDRFHVKQMVHGGKL